MKNTHILIPIKDIEDKIALLRVQLAKANEELDSLEYAWDGENRRIELSEDINGYSVGIIVCQQMLEAGKQISLDEEDIVIEKKANKFYKSANDSIIDGFVDGYKQALRDIIK